MSFGGRMKRNHQESENIMSFFAPSQKTMGPQRLQALKPSAVNTALKLAQAGKVIPKRKQRNLEETKGSKRVKVEVKSTQTEDADCSPDGMSNEAYELMVKETPPAAYWKEVADERQKALYNVLQENEKLHRDIETRDEQIRKLQGENEELQELAQHVQYMADMIERLTGKCPDSLEELKDIALDVEAADEVEHEDDVAGQSEHEEADCCLGDGETDQEQAGPSGEQD
ncbi:geminin isoform 1-T2 [Odontesthes bonariensis]|uniref:geminin n=1 Tax=Odontesthes bonariensis TaxID=219752 RepID=UPI003F58D806